MIPNDHEDDCTCFFIENIVAALHYNCITATLSKIPRNKDILYCKRKSMSS